MTHTSTPSISKPAANNDMYILSVATVIKELRNRGWLVLASNITRSFASHFSGIKETMTGAEFRQQYVSYRQERLRGITDTGDDFLKIMVEACEMQKSTWNLS